MSEDIYITGSFRGHALSTCFFMTQSQQIPILDSIKKRKPSFFSNNINIYSINNIICTLVDQIPFIAYKSQSEVTKKKMIYMISSPREEFAGVSKCLMSLCVRGNGGVKYVITSP